MFDAKLFDRDETSYELWLHANPEGFVANTFRKPAARYFVLHCATCRFISGTSRTPMRPRSPAAGMSRLLRNRP